MSKSEPSSTRIYVAPSTNDKIDMAHLRVMNRWGYKISKTDFIGKVIEIGLENEQALYDAYEPSNSSIYEAS